MRRDTGYLATLTPGWRSGICICALFVDRMADRFGDALLKSSSP
jgi:hypothetical protein